jgi:hypothetical protein
VVTGELTISVVLNMIEITAPNSSNGRFKSKNPVHPKETGKHQSIISHGMFYLWEKNES